MLFCQNGDKIIFQMCVCTVILEKIVNNFYGLVIIIRFCHKSNIHDDKTINSYFMPRHQTLKFSHNYKAKIYHVNFMNKNNRNPSIMRLNEEIEHDENTGISDEIQIAVVV